MSARIRSLSDFLALLKGVKQARDGQYMALCPGHHDTKPSLSVKEADGKILVQCFAGCELTGILKPLGLEPKDLFLNSHKAKTKLEHREIEAIYRYTNANGKPFEVVRFRPKAFAQRRPDGKGGYIWNLDGIVPTLYHQAELNQAITSGDELYVCEGEKDTDNLWALGLVATTSPMGVGKWRDSYTETLRGANVIVLPHKDKPGRDHAAQVSKSLYGIAAKIRILELPDRDGHAVKDVSDWLGFGGTRDELERLVKECPQYQPTEDLNKDSEGMLPLKLWQQKVLSQPKTQDLIQDILPAASTEYLLIAGRSGIGKTNLVLDMAFCLTTGQPWFSHKTQQCTVGYLAFEGMQAKLLGRIEKLQESFTDPGDYLRLRRELPFKLMGSGIDRLLRLINGLDVVIIDPIRYIVPGDYTKPEYASAFITTLKEICAKTKTIPILIHHVRKPDRRLTVRPEDLINEIKGAGDYVEAAATVLLLERARQSRTKDGRFGSNADDRVLHFCKVKDSPADFLPLNLQFDRNTLRYKPIDLNYDDSSNPEF